MYVLDRSRDLGAVDHRHVARRSLVEPVAERVLDFVTKWGRNASPFKLASVYLRLNWKGITYWRDVSKAAKAGRDLLGRVDGLEKGARVLKKAVEEQANAERQLPAYPLRNR